MINGATYGGISTMLLNYYTHMDRNKIHFDFVYSAEGAFGHDGEKLKELGAEFFYIPKKSSGLRKHIKQLDELIKKGDYDVIHVHSAHTSYVGLMVAWKNGIKGRFAHAHTAVKGRLGLKETISRRVGIILMKLFATKRLACTRDAAVSVFGRHSLKEKSMILVPNSINTEKFRYDENARIEIRKTFGIKLSTFVLGTVGRMSEEKNQIFLVGVLEKLKKIIPDSCLLLIGDGDKKNEIEKAVLEKNLKDSVIFTGNREDVSKILNAMDIFVVPSIYEGFSIAGLEAGTNGLPLILSDVIPRELAFLNRAEYISLNLSTGEWAKKIAIYSDVGRSSDAVEQVVRYGYDIIKSVKRMEQIYDGSC